MRQVFKAVPLLACLAACGTSPSSPQLIVSAPGDKAELTATFLGTSTVLFHAGRDAVLIDGFFTRPSPFELLFHGLSSDEDRIEEALQATKIARKRQPADLITLRAIFVAHSHFDHAMDSGDVARATGAEVIGSESTRFIVGGNLTFKEVSEAARYAFEPLEIRAFQTPHSCPVSFRGELKEPMEHPAHFTAYKEGGNYSFLVGLEKGPRALVVTSANFTPGNLNGVRADVVFLSIGKLGKQDSKFIRSFWEQTVLATGAGLVVPIHWDNLTIGLREGPLRRSPRPFDNVDKAMDEIRQMAKDDGVRFLEPAAFQSIPITASGRKPVPASLSAKGC